MKKTTVKLSIYKKEDFVFPLFFGDAEERIHYERKLKDKIPVGTLTQENAEIFFISWGFNIISCSITKDKEVYIFEKII